MMLTSTLSTLWRTGLPCVQKHSSVLSNCYKKACYSVVAVKCSLFAERHLAKGFLVPTSAFFLQERGLKYKGWVRRRCKDCYFVVRDQRMYVMCKTHPRHKQAVLQKKEKYTWILSHATQSPIRPW